MCKLLMSINPQHVQHILGGSKKFEFRKARCKKDIDHIIIYATAPVKQVVAEVTVTGIIEGTPSEVWRLTKEGAGIEKSFFDNYFLGRKKAVAYVLGKVERYPQPQLLSELGIKVAPQSYMYLN